MKQAVVKPVTVIEREACRESREETGGEIRTRTGMKARKMKGKLTKRFKKEKRKNKITKATRLPAGEAHTQTVRYREEMLR